MPSRLFDKGYAIASLDHRLSGDAIFPAGLEDCKAAVRWLRAHASEYGNLDTERIVAWGESAGAHQASMLAVTCASPEGDEFDVGDNLDQSSAVAGVVAYFGPTDFLQMDAQAPKDGMSMTHDPPDSPESKYIGGTIQEVPEKVARANPITYLQAGEKPPPFFLAHGTSEFKFKTKPPYRPHRRHCITPLSLANPGRRVDDHVVAYGQSILLEEALKKAGVPVTMHEVAGAEHGFIGATQEQIKDLDAATEEFLASIFG